MDLLTVLLGLALVLVYFISVRIQQIKKLHKISSKVQENGEGKHLPIPVVPGGLPFLGHFLQILFYPELFFDDCYKIYGPVFRIKLGTWSLAIVCDRNFIKHIWNQKHMSAGDFFDKVQLVEGRAVANDYFLHKIYNQLSSLSVKPELLKSYAENLMAKFEGMTKSSGDVDIQDTLQQYAHEIISHNLYEIDVSGPGIYEEFKNYNYYSGVSALAAFFLPMKLNTWLYEKPMHKPTPNLTSCLEAHLAKHKADKSLAGEGRIDFLTDLSDGDGMDGKPLSIHELTEAFLRLNDTTVHNLPSAILTTLTTLYQHPECLEVARSEAARLLREKDYRGIMESPILTASFIEASRLGISYLGSTFRAAPEDASEMGGYSMEGVDLLVPAGHVINAGEGAKGVYENESTYQPSRWLENKKLEATSTFGGRKHLCPAKAEATAMVNMTVAHFLTKFDLDMTNALVTDGQFLFRTIRNPQVKSSLKLIDSNQ